MKFTTPLSRLAALVLLAAAVAVSARDADDTRPRAMTAAEQADPPQSKPAAAKPAEQAKPAETKPAEKPADPRFAVIPDEAALVVQLNLNKLFSSATFKSVAASGDILSIRDELKQIPWTKDGALPDPVILYAPRMGSSYAMLVTTDRASSELKDMLSAQYADKKSVESERTGLGEKITVQSERIDRKTNRKTMRTEAEILCLNSRVAAFGRKGCPLDLGFFASESLPAKDFAKLQNLPENVVAAGLLLRFPVAASDDPTGLASLVNTGEFIAEEYQPGAVSAVLKLNCKGAKEAELAARRMKSFLRITLVSLFAADQALFRELNKSCTTSSEGNTATLEIKLAKASMDRVRAFYLLEQTVVSVAAGVTETVIKGMAGAKK